MKHRKSIYILLSALLAFQIILIPASAEYTGPNSGARRYSYEVEIPGYYEPSDRWLSFETIDLYVAGHDDEGPLYSGTIILNGKPYDIRTESDRAELTADIPEGVSSLKYYVTDPTGNRSEIIGN